LFYALLAIVVGVIVISAGVGGIPTMKKYWERSATRLEEKGAEVKAKARSPRDVVQEKTAGLRQEDTREQGGARRAGG
jgi:hypothetical protein